MKLLFFLLGLLLLAVLLPPLGHSARHRRAHAEGSSHYLPTPRLLPLRVLRTSHAAQRPKVVKAVKANEQ